MKLGFCSGGIRFRCSATLTVFYQADSRHHEFKRHATVEDVLVWAVKVFGIDPSVATEFELARHGQKEELPGTEHIGHLAGQHHVLEVDLVRGNIARLRMILHVRNLRENEILK